MEDERLIKRRKQAIEIISNRLAETYEMCEDDDDIDWLSHAYGVVTGQFLLRRNRKKKLTKG